MADPKELLEKYRGRSVDFYRFPGNYGDSLIWHGTKRLLASLDITDHDVDIACPIQNKVLFVDGGGNFVDYYHDVRDFLDRKQDAYEEIVILPHTIFGERQIETLNRLTADLTIFCREQVSAGFVETRVKRGRVHAWHDCAFYNTLAPEPEGEGVLRVFRSDAESARTEWPESNVDISRSGWAKKPLDDFLSAIRPHRRVDTDRLHVAIASALMGKEVRLFSNSYYKNRAVFDFSLRHFPNVSFVN